MAYCVADCRYHIAVPWFIGGALMLVLPIAWMHQADEVSYVLLVLASMGIMGCDGESPLCRGVGTDTAADSGATGLAKQARQLHHTLLIAHSRCSRLRALWTPPRGGPVSAFFPPQEG